MKNHGTQYETELYKMISGEGIACEHGSPSKAGDLVVFPNTIIEMKSVNNSNVFYYTDGTAEQQRKVLVEKIGTYPWVSVFYVVCFVNRSKVNNRVRLSHEWKWYDMPDPQKPLKKVDGKEMSGLIAILKARQEAFVAYNKMTETMGL